MCNRVEGEDISKILKNLIENINNEETKYNTLQEIFLKSYLPAIEKHIHAHMIDSKTPQEFKLNFTIATVCALSDLEHGKLTPQKFLCAGINIGSNKVFYYSQNSKTLVDITPNSCPTTKALRKESRSGNFKFFVHLCESNNDLILILSSSVYDSFDPQGRIPKDHSNKLLANKSWSKLLYNDPDRSIKRNEAIKEDIQKHQNKLESILTHFYLANKKKYEEKLDGNKFQKRDNKLASLKTGACIIFQVGQENELPFINAIPKPEQHFHAKNFPDDKFGTMYVDFSTAQKLKDM